MESYLPVFLIWSGAPIEAIMQAYEHYIQLVGGDIQKCAFVYTTFSISEEPERKGGPLKLEAFVFSCEWRIGEPQAAHLHYEV